ncbi:MAG: hypothetical protein ACYC6L_09935 [Anaerolineae bacterium]
MNHKAFLLVLILAILLVSFPIVVIADGPVYVDDLMLNEYCQANGWSGANLRTGTGNNYGPDYAYGNWRCVDADGGFHRLSMEQACKWQTGMNNVRTFPWDPNDAYTWYCYAVGHQF